MSNQQSSISHKMMSAAAGLTVSLPEGAQAAVVSQGQKLMQNIGNVTCKMAKNGIQSHKVNGMEVVELVKEKPGIISVLQEIRLEELDLIGKSVLELNFLKQVDSFGFYYNEGFLRRAVKRYEKYWLPLLAKLSSNPMDDINFAPPLDIHWVWHVSRLIRPNRENNRSYPHVFPQVHMLAPVAYSSDCQQISGRLLGHEMQTLQRYSELREKTKERWKADYPEVPFEIGADAADEEDSWVSQIKYNIVAAAMRQGAFYYQVSLDHYYHEDFLNDALVRYKMYLYLKSMNKETFLVPCYDIDLIWHTHQVHPGIYQKETKNLLGFVLKHDDSVNDRSEGSKLNNADEVTRVLWYETFQVCLEESSKKFLF